MTMRNGGPAFPATTVNDTDRNLTDPFGGLLPPGTQCPYPGMTLRDYFAAHAMQALVSTDNWTIERAGEEDASMADVAAEAYDLADAMLRARPA